MDIEFMGINIVRLNSYGNGFLKKESHYFGLMFLMCGCLVVFMTYFSPLYWEESPVSILFVDTISMFVPAIRFLSKNWYLYTNQWGLFYSLFYCLTPLFWFLGFFGSFYLSPERYSILIVETTRNRLVYVSIFMTFLLVLLFYVPLNSPGFILNQSSDFFLKRLLSWEAAAGVVYVHARFVAALMIKNKLTRK